MIAIAMLCVLVGCTQDESIPIQTEQLTSTSIPGKGDRPFVYCGISFGDAWPVTVDARSEHRVTVPADVSVLVLLSADCHGGAATILRASTGVNELQFYPDQSHAVAVRVTLMSRGRATLSVGDRGLVQHGVLIYGSGTSSFPPKG